MLEQYNARRMDQWTVFLTAMISLCERGVILGAPDAQTAYIHAQFSQRYPQG